jgi:PAS domain S-box-containing protein
MVYGSGRAVEFASRNSGDSNSVLARIFERCRSVPSFSGWTIATRITVVLLTLAVPLNLAIFTVIWHLSETANEAQRTNLLYTARSVAGAVDAKLGQYMALAQTLARSPALLEDDLSAFEAEARRAFTSPDAWVLVADVKGRQLMNMARPAGGDLPGRNPVTLPVQKRALEEGSPVITGVRQGMLSHAAIINIEVPIFKNGQPFRELAVAVRAVSFLRLLNDQQIPKNWLAGIVDSQGRFIARVPDNGRYAGQLASESWRKIKDQDGVFEPVSVEGDRVVHANAHSPVSGWLIGICVKKTEMQAAVWGAIRWAMILGGGFSLLSLFFACAMARSITVPIANLRRKAGALLAGPETSKPQGPPEIRELWQALTRSEADREQSGRALRESEQRLRGIFEHAGTGIAIKDLAGRFQSCNPAYASMLGYSEAELREHVCENLMHVDDRAANNVQQERLVAGEIPSFETLTRYFSRDGKVLWGHRHVSLLKDGTGTATNVIVLVTNISGQKRDEEHIRLLLREVNHRSKNFLALVQAVARQTLATKPEDFIGRFVERIQALAASQDLLVKNAWKGADIGELARAQLAHFKDLIGTRIELKGPPLLISASAAQTIGMALHELATNAGKYGALTNSAGRVTIEWRLEGSQAADAIFGLCWCEQGGPPVTEPRRRGFGSTVIGSLAERSLDASIDLCFDNAGLCWRLSSNAANVLEGARPFHAGASPGAPVTPVQFCPRACVLVVEDEPIVALEIAQVLDAAGFDVAGPVGSTPAALQLLKHGGCDAAVLDINLGGETSEAVALELLRRGTPFVILSGYSRDQYPPAFRNAPALMKPLRPEHLVAELKRCIEPECSNAEKPSQRRLAEPTGAHK